MSTYYARKFGTDHDGECDMRAEAEYLRRSDLEPDECAGCAQVDCTGCPTLPLDEEEE